MKDSQEWFLQGSDRVASHDENKQTKKQTQRKNTEENFGDKSVLGKRKSKFYKDEARWEMAWQVYKEH